MQESKNTNFLNIIGLVTVHCSICGKEKKEFPVSEVRYDWVCAKCEEGVGIQWKSTTNSLLLFGGVEHKPDFLLIDKTTVYNSIDALEAGLEYARECLAAHDSALGRTTYKNKSWAETIEKDIRQISTTLNQLYKAVGSSKKV